MAASSRGISAKGLSLGGNWPQAVANVPLATSSNNTSTVQRVLRQIGTMASGMSRRGRLKMSHSQPSRWPNLVPCILWAQ